MPHGPENYPITLGGGMSSLPVDKVISPAYGSTAGGPIAGTDTPQSPPFIVAKDRMFSDASPWVMSGLRRTVECSVAAVALLFLMPVLALAAMLVFLDSEGPILFRQQRMGRNGREFTLYKFRSMRVNAARLSCITVTGDSRITSAGSFLRRHKLDELPQFWNVLRGDMGLVGPRPKLPHHEALHMICRPGITGAATLAFRHEEKLLSTVPAHQLDSFYEHFIKPVKAQLDVEYMRSATLMSDLKILYRTFAACLDSDECDDRPAPLAEHAQAIARYAAAPAGTPEN